MNDAREMLEQVTNELLAHGEFSASGNNRPNARLAAQAVIDIILVRTASERLAAAPESLADEIKRVDALPPTDEQIEIACAAYAKATGYYVEFHKGLRSESSDRMRRGMRAALALLPQEPAQPRANVVAGPLADRALEHIAEVANYGAKKLNEIDPAYLSPKIAGAINAAVERLWLIARTAKATSLPPPHQQEPAQPVAVPSTTRRGGEK